MRRTIINLTPETKQRFEQLKKDCSDNPECKDETFLIEIMDFVQEQSKEQEPKP